MRLLAGLFVVVLIGFVASTSAIGQVRAFGAGAFVVDDNAGHKLTLTTPQPGDPGYSAWTSAGPLTWRLPIPPSSGASMGFVVPGTASLQVLAWDPPTSLGGTGGAQGAWRGSSLAALGGVTGTGTAGSLVKWTSASTVGNSIVSENAGIVTLSGYGAGVIHANASGALSSSPVALGTDVSGVLPISNGGTGSATQNFVDLTTNQSVAGTKTFTTGVDAATISHGGSIAINPGAGNTLSTNGNISFAGGLTGGYFAPAAAASVVIPSTAYIVEIAPSAAVTSITLPPAVNGKELHIHNASTFMTVGDVVIAPGMVVGLMATGGTWMLEN